MRKTAVLRDVILLGGIIKYEFFVNTKENVKTLLEKLKEKNFSGVKYTGRTVTAYKKIEPNALNLSIWKVAYAEVADLGCDDLLSQDDTNENPKYEGSYFFNVIIDNDNDDKRINKIIQQTLNKEYGVNLTKNIQEEKDGSYIKQMSIKADSALEAEETLKYLLATTKAHLGTYSPTVSVSENLRKYQRMKRAPHFRASLSPKQLKQYILATIPEYLDGMKEYFDKAFSSIKGIFTKLNEIDLDEAIKREEDFLGDRIINNEHIDIRRNGRRLVKTDTGLEKAIKDLEVAAWFAFRAKRLERLYYFRQFDQMGDDELLNKLEAKAPYTKDKGVDEYTYGENLLSKFKKAIKDTKQDIKTVFSDYLGENPSLDVNVSEDIKNYLNTQLASIKDDAVRQELQKFTEVFKNEKGVSPTKAKGELGPIKDALRAALVAAITSNITTQNNETKDSVAKALAEYIDTNYNMSSYGKMEIKDYLKFTKFHEDGTYDGAGDIIEQIAKDPVAIDQLSGNLPYFLDVRFEDIKDDPTTYKYYLKLFKEKLDGIKKLLTDENTNIMNDYEIVKQYANAENLSEEQRSAVSAARKRINEKAPLINRQLKANYGGETCSRVVKYLKHWEELYTAAEAESKTLKEDSTKNDSESETEILFNIDPYLEKIKPVEPTEYMAGSDLVDDVNKFFEKNPNADEKSKKDFFNNKVKDILDEIHALAGDHTLEYFIQNGSDVDLDKFKHYIGVLKYIQQLLGLSGNAWHKKFNNVSDLERFEDYYDSLHELIGKATPDELVAKFNTLKKALVKYKDKNYSKEEQDAPKEEQPEALQELNVFLENVEDDIKAINANKNWKPEPVTQKETKQEPEQYEQKIEPTDEEKDLSSSQERITEKDLNDTKIPDGTDYGEQTTQKQLEDQGK